MWCGVVLMNDESCDVNCNLMRMGWVWWNFRVYNSYCFVDFGAQSGPYRYMSLFFYIWDYKGVDC
jgi:hypothetical protein